MEKKFITVKELSELTGYKVGTIYNKCQDGTLSYHKMGGKYLFSQEDMEENIKKFGRKN